MRTSISTRMCLYTVLAAMALAACGGRGAFPGDAPTATAVVNPTPEGDIVLDPPYKDASSDSPPPCSALSRIEHLDIQYQDLPDVDPALQRLDLYTPVLPQGCGLAPVMVYVHGGGWWSGDKANVGYKADAFTQRGWVFVSANYRLTPDAIFPDHAVDVARAVVWVHKHAAEYGGDPRRIFLMGHSAGAHLVTLIGTDSSYLEAEGLHLTDIQGIVSIDAAVYDLPRMAANNGGKLDGSYAETFGEDPELWSSASPITHVQAGHSIPPMICLYSAGHSVERINPEREAIARDFAARLAHEGIMSEVTGDLTKDHGMINQDFGAPGEEMAAAAFAFLERTTPYTRLVSAVDYPVGTRDASGQYIGGTEIMNLTTHQGQLFAGNGYWNDERGVDPLPGAQILVKRSAAGPWELDFEFPKPGRIGCLASVTFTTDKNGTALNPPVTILLAGPEYARSNEASVWTRDDDSGSWTKTTVAVDIKESQHAYVRAMIDHVDRVTGVHHVFAGVATSALYRGAYDPDAPGRIRWDPIPELTGAERMHSAAVANGVLYVTVGTNGAPSDQDGGLFRRTDGVVPSWSLIFEWDRQPNKGPGLRGLTAVPDPAGSGYEVLIGALESVGHVLRIDPMANHQVTIEFDYKNYFTTVWGSLGGRATLAAYNNIISVPDPLTGRQLQLIGLFINHPKGDVPPYNGSYFLVRHSNGAYAWGNLYDYHNPVPRGAMLRGTRTMVLSPFPGESAVVYAGGFDAASGPWHNTAWIYRAILPGYEP